MQEEAIRWRLKIEVQGRHIGFVSFYFLLENMNLPDWTLIDIHKSPEENHVIRCLGIEICESDFWSRGIGTKALSVFMEYYGEKRDTLETRPGNFRMMRCAEKLGFKLSKKNIGCYQVEGKSYDALAYVKETQKFAF